MYMQGINNITTKRFHIALSAMELIAPLLSLEILSVILTEYSLDVCLGYTHSEFLGDRGAFCVGRNAIEERNWHAGYGRHAGFAVRFDCYPPSDFHAD